MGKVAKPLTIVVFSPLSEWPEIEKLEKQGHIILKGPHAPAEFEDLDPDSCVEFYCKLSRADIILGPRCWYLTELHRKHLQAAIKQSRLRRYGTITKKRKKGNDDEETIPDTDPEPTGC